MDEELLKQLAQKVEKDFNAGGLSEGIYLRFALEVTRRYVEIMYPPKNFFIVLSWNADGSSQPIQTYFYNIKDLLALVCFEIDNHKQVSITLIDGKNTPHLVWATNLPKESENA